MLYKGEELRDINLHYSVSNFGRVFSKPLNGIRSDGLPQKRGWTELAQTLNNKGYPTVRIDKVIKTVHRLVAKHFIPNPEDKPEVNHINRVKHNNHVQNLEWCTSSENSQKYFETRCVTRVDCFDLDNNFIKRYNSVKEASEETEVANPNIYAMINGKEYPKSGKGFVFKKAIDINSLPKEDKEL